MNVSEKLPVLAKQFAPDGTDPRSAEADVRRWIAGQAREVRDLCPARRLRCFALVTNGRYHPHAISVEFAAPDDTNHTVLIRADGRHELDGREPHTVSLAAAIKLLALLTDELGVAVTLQP